MGEWLEKHKTNYNNNNKKEHKSFAKRALQSKAGNLATEKKENK